MLYLLQFHGFENTIGWRCSHHPPRYTMLRLQPVILAAAWLTAACAHAGDVDPNRLPQGWTPLPDAAALSGAFRQAGSADAALLVQHGAGGDYGLAVMFGADGGRPAAIVANFKDIKANPPQLSLIKPGSYQPRCSPGSGKDGGCQPQEIVNEAIGLCFGEASCEILYFSGGAFRALRMTD
jgi:hypothetical protein